MGTKIATRTTAEERRDEVERLHQSITTQLEELTRGDQWMQCLKLAIGFH